MVITGRIENERYEWSEFIVWISFIRSHLQPFNKSPTTRKTKLTIWSGQVLCEVTSWIYLMMVLLLVVK